MGWRIILTITAHIPRIKRTGRLKTGSLGGEIHSPVVWIVATIKDGGRMFLRNQPTALCGDYNIGHANL